MKAACILACILERRRRPLPGAPMGVRANAGHRTLIWNQNHLLRALREFDAFYNEHRPHQGIANARPLNPLPQPITDPDQIARLDVRRHQRLGESSTSTGMPLELDG